MTIDIVVGGLYGSEAKGHATQRLVEKRIQYGDVCNIRVGGPNAGHTGYDSDGNPWAFRQVPVGVLVDVPEGRTLGLEIAAGSEIDLPVLLDEIDRCLEAGLFTKKRLFVHGEATMLEDRHKAIEAGHVLIGANGCYGSTGEIEIGNAESLVSSIGSTGKGIGAARADRMLRGATLLREDRIAMDLLKERGVEIVYGDSGDWRGRNTRRIVIEGTQGYALGLHAGFYPQCTTSDCRAVDFLSMAGVSPWDGRYAIGGPHDGLRVWVVARVFPIRVAGNSGHMSAETTWADLGLPEERTTVTQKVRRVGLPDWALVRDAVRANGGTPVVRLALSMVDQMFSEVRDVPWSMADDRWRDASAFLANVESEVGAPISLVMSGPNTAAFRGKGGDR